MKMLPAALGRTLARQSLVVKKNSPALLFGTGVISMVGSTVLACRATLKLDDVLAQIEHDKMSAEGAKSLVDEDKVPEGTTYSDSEYKRDVVVITARGVFQVVKLYAPSVVLGGVGVICLTKSHSILRDRNTALTAAYVAVDKAFTTYRERVVERYGADVDRELRYESEEIDIIDDDTGKVVSRYQAAQIDHGMYARWFDAESSQSFNPPPNDEYNLVFLRNTQNWANDMLKSRGHLMLNEVYGLVGLSHTSAGAVVGWIYDRNNPVGDNIVDFGIFNRPDDAPEPFFNGREGAILLDFNVDGPIWDLLDERSGKK